MDAFGRRHPTTWRSSSQSTSELAIGCHEARWDSSMPGQHNPCVDWYAAGGPGENQAQHKVRASRCESPIVTSAAARVEGLYGPAVDGQIKGRMRSGSSNREFGRE